MSDVVEELARRLVIGRKRDGRCVYDEQAKAELVAECAKPGASVSRLARAAGVNANQLSRWVRERELGGRRRSIAVVAEPVPATFVPVVIESGALAPTSVPAPAPTAVPTIGLQARMPNGVVIDFSGVDLTQVGQLFDALGRLRCSALTSD